MVVVGWRVFEGDVSHFLNLGDDFVRRLPEGTIPPDWHVDAGQGFDGQLFYYQAHDPFLLGDWPGDWAELLERPAYRGRRLVYPLFAWCLWRVTGGSIDVPPALFVVNVLALGALFVCLAGLLVSSRDRWASASPEDSMRSGGLALLALAVSTFVLFPLLVTTSEIVCMAFLAASIWALERGRLVVCFLCASLAVLTKETAVLWIGALLLDALVKKEPRRIVGSLLSLLPLVIWQGILFARFPAQDLVVPASMGWPFEGMLREVLTTQGLSRRNFFPLIAIPSYLFLIVWGAREISRRAMDPIGWFFLASALLVVCLGECPWDYVLNFGRQLFCLYLAAVVLVLRGGVRHPRMARLAVWATASHGLLYVVPKIILGSG